MSNNGLIDWEKLELVKRGFRERGETIKSWAEANGFQVAAVAQVLNGFTKCQRGKRHQIAVALGIK